MDAFLLDVLIVDDELPLRQELRSLPWHAFGAKLVGEAENGAEALEKCRALRPDVVVTDISMPIMDGLDLMKALKEESPAVQIILLTCHSDFEFAREALQSGALGYLLKVTLSEDELGESLKKARRNRRREEIVRKAERDTRRIELAKQFGHLKMGLDRDGGLHGPESRISRLEIGLRYPLHFVRIRISCASDDALFIRPVLTDRLSRLERDGSSTWFQVSPLEYCICFYNLELKTLSSKTEKLLAELHAMVEQELPFISKETCFYAMVSERVAATEAFIRSFECSNEWESSIFYDGEDGKRQFAGHPEPMQGMDEALTSELSTLAMRIDWSRDELTHFFREPFYTWCLQKRIVPDELKNWAAVWRLKWLDAPRIAKEESRLVQRILKSPTLSEFVSALIYDVEVRSGDGPAGRKEIRDAKKMIAERLDTPLTLLQVSKEVGLSPQYLSKLFHESAGESFNEYITKVRMRKAVELLRGTNLKVYEVAERVGIPSYRYFSVLFRKNLGRSPSDYRKRAGL